MTLFVGIFTLFLLLLLFFSSMKHVSIMRFYLALASFVGLVGTVVGYGNFGYEFAKSQIISNDEYIAGQRGYEIKSCEDPISTSSANAKGDVITESKKRSPEDIEKCKTETRARLITERQYQLKDAAIGGGVWGTLFFLIFLGHFPIFLRSSRKED